MHGSIHKIHAARPGQTQRATRQREGERERGRHARVRFVLARVHPRAVRLGPRKASGSIPIEWRIN